MAQEVGYWENTLTDERRAEAFNEGPFVLVDANGWRIEVEFKGYRCPILPHQSIYELREKVGLPIGKTFDREKAERTCDALNAMVRDGLIVRDERGFWRAA